MCVLSIKVPIRKKKSGNLLCAPCIFTVSPILVSKSCQAFLQAAGSHLIFLNAVRVSITSAWKDWALWSVSRPHTSCVSPGETPVQCIWGFSTCHCILVRWIFKSPIFLHIFPQGHIEFGNWLFKGCVRYCLIIPVRDLMLPPLGIPWGYVTVVVSVALIFHKTYVIYGLSSPLSFQCVNQTVPE